MNRENMLKIADAIDAERVDGFGKVVLHMSTWHGYQSWCGTTACVGGFADLISKRELLDREYEDFIKRSHAREKDQTGMSGSRPDVMRRATEWLDLGYGESRALMTDSHVFETIHQLHEKDRKIVSDAIRWMALTGRVDWYGGLIASTCVNKV